MFIYLAAKYPRSAQPFMPQEYIGVSGSQHLTFCWLCTNFLTFPTLNIAKIPKGSQIWVKRSTLELWFLQSKLQAIPVFFVSLIPFLIPKQLFLPNSGLSLSLQHSLCPFTSWFPCGETEMRLGLCNSLHRSGTVPSASLTHTHTHTLSWISPDTFLQYTYLSESLCTDLKVAAISLGVLPTFFCLFCIPLSEG